MASDRPVVTNVQSSSVSLHRLRRRARHDDERGLADLARAVAGLVVPAVRPVDHVEEPTTEDDSTRTGGRLAQESAIVGVVGERPGVQSLASAAETGLRAGVGPGDEAVEGDRDVRDDSSHTRADPARPASHRHTQLGFEQGSDLP